jgi:hypothetical protein
MKREFYPLDHAASQLGMSEEDLIHLAAWNYGGKVISIHILTAHFDVSRIHVDKEGALDEYPISSTTKVEKLSLACLQELEAGNRDAEVSFDRQPFYEFDPSEFDDPLYALLTKLEPREINGHWRLGLRRRNVDYPLLYEFRPRRLFDSTYPEPIKIRECKMVVLAEDLERFQQNSASISKPATLTENERGKLLKQIASLALLLSEKSNKYKRGEKPIASRLAEDVGLIFDAFEFEGKKGAGNSELRDSIAKGVKLLLDE